MPCPPQYVPNVRQFSDDLDGFWDAFVAANPVPAYVNTCDTAVEVWLHSRFEQQYTHCFAKLAQSNHPYDFYNLPEPIKAQVRACMLASP